MRDPERIKPTLKLIEEFWLEHPDLRLGQLISNCLAMCNRYEITQADLFSIEDIDLIIGLGSLKTIITGSSSEIQTSSDECKDAPLVGETAG